MWVENELAACVNVRSATQLRVRHWRVEVICCAKHLMDLHRELLVIGFIVGLFEGMGTRT